MLAALIYSVYTQTHISIKRFEFGTTHTNTHTDDDNSSARPVPEAHMHKYAHNTTNACM